jgi:putative flippase GtrA
LPIADVETLRAPGSHVLVERARRFASESLGGRRAPGARFDPAQPILFALVGASSAVLDVSMFWLLTRQGQLAPLVANAVSYGIAAGNSFILNKLLTFRHRKTRHGAKMQAALFILARCLCLIVCTLALAAALRFAPSLVAKLMASAVTLGVAYTLSSRLVFGEANRSPRRGQRAPTIALPTEAAREGEGSPLHDRHRRLARGGWGSKPRAGAGCSADR